MSLSPEQIQMRKTGVSASQAAAACGLSKYQQTAELYLEKTGQSEPDDLSMNRDVLFGTHMEEGGIRYWQALRQQPVEYPLPTVRHKEHDFMLATPDGKLSSRKGLEFKTMDFFRFRKLESQGIAEVIPEYVLQVQQTMEVCEWDEIVIVVLVGKDLHDIPVERDDRLINLIVERERTFWDHVQRRVPPPLDFSRDGALRAIQALHPNIKTGDVVRLSEASVASWMEHEALGSPDKLKKQKDLLKAPAMAEIGDNLGGLLPDGRIVARNIVNRKGYVVEPCEYMTCRARKYKDENIIELEADTGPDDFDADDNTADRIDLRLCEAGFMCHETSPSGSRYYIHKTGPERVRVADHDANQKTAEWMERSDVAEIRVDGDPWTELGAIIESVHEYQKAMSQS